MDLISVLIPCYNVESFLNRCIESVVKQTYTELEIILVDDGSSDKTADICRKWAGQDNRIRFIEQENQGVSVARNRALEAACGVFYVFVDSDDMITEDYIETLYKLLKKHDADLVGCYFEWIDSSDNKNQIAQPLAEAFEGDSNVFIEKMYDNIVSLVPAWGKLAKKEVYEGIEFPANHIHEDGFVCRKIAENCKKIVWTDKRLYKYRANEKGISRSIDTRNIDDDFKWIEQDIDHFTKNNNQRLLSRASKLYCYKAIYWWKKMDAKAKKEVHKKYVEYLGFVLEDRTIRLKAKVKYLLYSILLLFM